MKTNFYTFLRSVLTALFVVSFMLFGHGQIVTTDRVDYMPGDSVIVSGQGWLPFESIQLDLTKFPAASPVKAFDAW